MVNGVGVGGGRCMVKEMRALFVSMSLSLWVLWVWVPLEELARVG